MNHIMTDRAQERVSTAARCPSWCTIDHAADASDLHTSDDWSGATTEARGGSASLQGSREQRRSMQRRQTWPRGYHARKPDRLPGCPQPQARLGAVFFPPQSAHRQEATGALPAKSGQNAFRFLHTPAGAGAERPGLRPRRLPRDAPRNHGDSRPPPAPLLAEPSLQSASPVHESSLHGTGGAHPKG